MFRRLFPKKQVSVSARFDDRHQLGYDENFLFLDMVVVEVETAVAEFEALQEEREREERAKQRKPDYTWLVSGKHKLHHKYLTAEERNRVENACERLKPEEWSSTIRTWKQHSEKATTRKAIIDEFLTATHATISDRRLRADKKSQPAPTSPLTATTTAQATPTSPRSVMQLSIMELHEIV